MTGVNLWIHAGRWCHGNQRPGLWRRNYTCLQDQFPLHIHFCNWVLSLSFLWVHSLMVTECQQPARLVTSSSSQWHFVHPENYKASCSLWFTLKCIKTLIQACFNLCSRWHRSCLLIVFSINAFEEQLTSEYVTSAFLSFACIVWIYIYMCLFCSCFHFSL